MKTILLMLIFIIVGCSSGYIVDNEGQKKNYILERFVRLTVKSEITNYEKLCSYYTFENNVLRTVCVKENNWNESTKIHEYITFPTNTVIILTVECPYCYTNYKEEL